MWMEQMDLRDAEMGRPPLESKGNGPEQDQLLSPPAETQETSENKPQKCFWTDLANRCKANPKKVICGAAAIVVIPVIILCCEFLIGGNRNLNQLAPNCSQEDWTDNTTANCQNMGNQTMGNQTKCHLCSKAISDLIDRNMSISCYIQGELNGTCCQLDNREGIICSTAEEKVTWFKANETCREIGGHLLISEDPNTLEALSLITKDVFYWFGVICAPSGICRMTDGTPYNLNKLNASPPRRNRTSCVTLKSGKIHFEMCLDTKRFICMFPC